MSSLNSIEGKDNRRVAAPSLLWIREDVPSERHVHDRRLDSDSLQVLTGLIKQVMSGECHGIVFAAVSQAGTVDLGASGVLYRDVVLAQYVIDRLRRIVTELPNHPDGVNSSAF